MTLQAFHFRFAKPTISGALVLLDMQGLSSCAVSLKQQALTTQRHPRKEANWKRYSATSSSSYRGQSEVTGFREANENA